MLNSWMLSTENIKSTEKAAVIMMAGLNHLLAYSAIVSLEINNQCYVVRFFRGFRGQALVLVARIYWPK
jgi:hypothetical protein